MHIARTTTGQSLSISYDAGANALVFSESDWFAEPVRSSGVPAKGRSQRLLPVPPRALPRRPSRRRILLRAL